MRRPFRSLVLALPLVVASALAQADERRVPKLALLGVTPGEGFSDKQARSLEEFLLSSLSTGGLVKVSGSSDIKVLLGLEAQKQQLGCEDDASCLAELAGALGVDYVASADAGRLGEVALLTLKVIHVGSATTIARPRRALRNDSEYVSASEQVAKEALQAIEAHRNQRRSGPSGPSTLELAGFAGIGLGVVLAGVAGGLALTAGADTASLRTTPRPGADAQALIESINARADAAPVLGVLGGVLAAAGIGLVVVF